MQNFPCALTFKREWNNSAMVINSNHIPLMWQSLSHRILSGLCQLMELHTEIPFLEKSSLLWDTTLFPSTTSISCGISDLKASLEWGPESRERQWLGSSWGWCHWGDIPEELADAPVSILALFYMAMCDTWRGRAYTSLSHVSKSVTWHDIGALPFRFLDQPACSVTPWSQIVH